MAMKEPFVYPVGRDFAARREDVTQFGHPALDELSLDELLKKGIRRQVSIYTTHTIVDYNSIYNDTFYLGNHLFGIKIPCKLIRTSVEEGLHHPVLVHIYEIAEKFTIRVTDHGVIITGREGNSMEFCAGEALMLLDILKDEETELRKIAEEASPLPVKIKI